MTSHHIEILEEIKKEAQKVDPKRISSTYLPSYIGTTRKSYGISIPTLRTIAKNWVTRNKNLSRSDFLEIVDSLFTGESHEEKTIAAEILEYLPKQIKEQINPFLLDTWLNYVEGWAEVDCLCQPYTDGKSFVQKFEVWEKVIEQFRSDKNICKRRASLVLLTRPVSTSSEAEIADLALETIHTLQHEKDILITKAISWLLRSLVKNHMQKVKEYLEDNKTQLPKIALRETKRKIETGKK